MAKHGRRGIGTAGQGQAMVEFALVVPIFMLIVVGLIDVARVVYYYDVISNAAREGSREAIVKYNQCSNTSLAASQAAGCQAPPNTTTLLGVKPAMDAVTGGIMKVQLLDSNTPGYAGPVGTAPACTHQAGATTVAGPAPNGGCVWVFEQGNNGGTSGNPPLCGPGPTDQYTSCNYSAFKPSAPSSGTPYDVVVEIEYQFQPFTPMIGQFWPNGGVLWAKSEMRAEY